MIAGGAAAPPALAADFTVTSSAELIQAIEDANAAPGIDAITVDGAITLEADLPPITDGLVIQGVNGAVIDGNARAYSGVSAADIDHLSIESVDFRALRGNTIHASNWLFGHSVGVRLAG